MIHNHSSKKGYWKLDESLHTVDMIIYLLVFISLKAETCGITEQEQSHHGPP